jgi:membrane dipeptidase
MNDDMIRRLAKNNGVMQINFGSTFLDGNISKQMDEKRAELTRLLEEKGLSYDDEEAKPVIDKFQEENEVLMADVKTVADHIDHVVSLVGVNHVGFGSDYDGVGDTLPTGLKDVAQYPNLIYELLKRGYSESDIEKICYKNVWRVWQAVEDAAE